MTELICIVCPRGCHLKVDENKGYTVTGNSCEKGEAYGKNELINPMRTVTSTIKIDGAIHKRCPVKTNIPISKAKMLDAVKALNGITLHSPVKVGDMVIKNVADTGADIIICKDM